MKEAKSNLGISVHNYTTINNYASMCMRKRGNGSVFVCVCVSVW